MDRQRRIFFLRSAEVAAAAVGSTVAIAPQAAQAQGASSKAGRPQAPTGSTASAGSDSYVFFNADEAAFIEAACERLIPSGDDGPGAREAGVSHYIDRQLGGAWGAGERLYRSGPWQPGTPTQGYQLPFTPAELFRTALSALAAQAARGTPLHKMDAAAQDDFLYALQTGKNDLGGVPANIFFDSLWSLTVEGFFSDPVYGGNRDMVGWKLIGFPGAYANYYQYIDQHGVAFTAPPISLASNGRGEVHVHPGIPAAGGAMAMPAARPNNTKGR